MTRKKTKRPPGKKKRKPYTRTPGKKDQLRHAEFARYYLAVGTKTYFNAERSAAACGYAEKTVKHCAYQILRNAGVQKEMKRLRDERAKISTIASPEEVLETLTAQMRMLPNRLYDEKGGLVPGHKMTDDQAQAVQGIKVKRRTIMGSEDEYIEEVTTEYKLTDRQKAAIELAKHHGLYEKDNAQGKPDPNIIQLVNAPRPMSMEEWEAQAQEAHRRMMERKAQPLLLEEKAA